MTGLIYVVIIALWAAVLIPIWLRRHDQISEVRSTAKFSSAMKSLGREGKRKGSSATAPTTPRDAARQRAAVRRAVIMGVLSAALAVTLVLAILGVVPQVAPIVLAIVVLAYVVAAAATSSQRGSSADRRSRDRRTNEGYDDHYTEHEEYKEYAETAYFDDVAEVAYPRTRGVQPRTRRSRDAQVAAAMDDFLAWDPWEGEVEQAADGWSAVPTTLPTYVNAPRATRVRRPIERDRDWSGEAMVEAAQTMRRPRMTAEDLMDDRYALESNASPTAGDETAEIPAVRFDQSQRAAGE